jgi:acyl-CoA thioester hydrolase
MKHIAAEPMDHFTSELLVTGRGRIIEDWIDHNEHMNVAYYLLIFDKATDTFHAMLGKDEAYIRRTQCSTFALEMHLTYERELRLGDPYTVHTRLVDADHKRVHILHEMRHGDEGWLAATNESISMHIDLQRRRSAPYPPELQRRVDALKSAHAGLPPDDHIGRRVGIRRRKTT